MRPQRVALRIIDATGKGACHQAPFSSFPKAGDIAVKPGMTVSIDVRTGTRSVLGYIAKPIFKAFGGALTER